MGEPKICKVFFSATVPTATGLLICVDVASQCSSMRCCAVGGWGALHVALTVSWCRCCNYCKLAIHWWWVNRTNTRSLGLRLWRTIGCLLGNVWHHEVSYGGAGAFGVAGMRKGWDI